MNSTTTTSTSSTSSPDNETNDAPPAPSNLDSHPESVACTVSPPDTYAFLKPTPVVLLTGPFGGNWCYRDTWQTTLADQGYQSTSVELSMPDKELETGDAYIRHFVKILKKSIETDHSFYPPILIAHGLHALVAQKYVESNPVSALVLVSPFIPSVVKGRFQELSHKLQAAKDSAATTSKPLQTDTTAAPEASQVLEEKSSADEKDPSTETTPQEPSTPSSPLPDFDFETHADVLAQDGFREKYVLPKKAVYKIDRVAQEHLEKEKELQITKQEETEMKEQAEKLGQGKGHSPEGTQETIEQEKLGKDSIPVWEASDEEKQEESVSETEETLPVLTVESEASIPSSLEQLPLRIYDSIPVSLFEPTFPILLVTSNADEIVSTADVKTHHFLADEVDHIELEDLDDGGHLIMVSDNAEWEQGIQGITAWLDSNGM
ncbi:hypothetical protein BGZ74_000695 [Mortierella antarctica]|nr:hypothetical protein BGZ74_000695 [Mortierella antarctica]